MFSYKKVGGLHFIKCGAFTFMFCKRAKTKSVKRKAAEPRIAQVPVANF